MTSSGGKIFARRVRNEVAFLVIGRVTANHSPALRQFAEEALAGGAATIQVDLRDCTHCDSTFLGTLLGLRQSCLDRAPGALCLVRPSPAVRHILAQIGAEKLFQITDHAAAANSDITWQQLQDHFDRAQTTRFKQNIVDAHQALAGASGELAERFGPLAEAMRQELMTDQDEPK